APLAIVFAACGEDGGNGTADAPPPDPCMPQMTITGELVDWDSGGAVPFMGIFGSTLTVRDDPSIMDVTAPNGRFEMCIPAADGLVDVSAMSASDYVSGVVVVDRVVQAALPVLSFRSFTATRAADFAFDVSAGHVYVHIVGGDRTVSAPSATAHTFTNGDWQAGGAGTDIYLANIPLAAETTLTVSGGNVTGSTRVPLSAGQFTYVTLLAR